jgi:hypothetical protein
MDNERMIYRTLLDFKYARDRRGMGNLTPEAIHGFCRESDNASFFQERCGGGDLAVRCRRHYLRIICAESTA